ncbi:maleylpyruvate isomerase family mycothiol-dependent enzyme [Streptomyces sp. NPDC090442]|uniref:maleylpyruvate isomerase family mycothiol-dependent enzyme n=1 Tax=Streptomyces sp. NPDC090442 TaxID=3365962 RepID=UPI0038186516
MTTTTHHRGPLAQHLTWLDEGTHLLLTHLDRLPNAEITAPTPLPDWTRAHLLAHLARNADALRNLATWAHTGVETPMYHDLDQRDRDIQRSANQPPPQLRSDVRISAARLAQALAALPTSAWSTQVRSALGRDIPASQIPWLRIREVWIHTVDLGAGVSFADLPHDLVDALLSDVITGLARKEGAPALALRPTDRTTTWHLSAPGTLTEVAGPAAELLAWLTGRADGAPLRPATGELPSLPRWL